MKIVILASSDEDYFTCAVDQVAMLEKHHKVKFNETDKGFICSKFEILPADLTELKTLDNWMLIKYEGFEHHKDCQEILKLYKEEMKRRQQ